MFLRDSLYAEYQIGCPACEVVVFYLSHMDNTADFLGPWLPVTGDVDIAHFEHAESWPMFSDDAPAKLFSIEYREQDGQREMRATLSASSDGRGPYGAGVHYPVDGFRLRYRS